MIRRRILTAVCLVVVAAGAAWLVIDQPSSSSDRPAARGGRDTPMLALGREVYQAQCAACHGAHLQGQPNWRQRGPDGLLPAPPHDATGHTWHHSDETLFRITKFGVARAANLPGYATAMPAFEGVLTDREIVAVLGWIKSHWPDDIRARHDRLNQQTKPAP